MEERRQNAQGTSTVSAWPAVIAAAASTTTATSPVAVSDASTVCQDHGMDEFGGKVAVVTGAASGIGRALVDAWLAEGCRVVMADVEEPALKAAHDALADDGRDRAIVVPTDVA